MSTEELASKISGETPWWATAPIWLAAGIVGVPSLLAIGAGYFIAKTVVTKLDNNREDIAGAVATAHTISDRIKIFHDQDMQEFHLMRDYLAQIVRIEFRSCVREARNPQEREDCLRTAKSDIERLQSAP
jgi:hypothetical protein